MKDRGNLFSVAALVLGAMCLLLSPTQRVRAHDTQHMDSAAHAKHKLNGTAKSNYKRSIHDYDIPDVTLIDEDGTAVSLLAELNADTPTMMNFIFTSCATICPVLSVIFSQTQKSLAPELGTFKMISISIDPEHDTPERLRAYADRHKAGPQWHFLTGHYADILAVQKAFDVFRGNKMSHEPFTFLRASADAPWVRLDGFASAADLTGEIRRIVSQ